MCIGAQNLCEMLLKQDVKRHAKIFPVHVHKQIAKPREMGNLSSVGKVVGLRRVWVWRPQLRLKPATQKKGELQDCTQYGCTDD